MNRSIILVSPPEAAARHATLFAMLERAFAVRFLPWRAGERQHGDGHLVLVDNPTDALGRAAATCPCLAMALGSDTPAGDSNPAYDFGTSPSVPRPLRGAKLREQRSSIIGVPVRLAEGFEVIARRGTDAVWIAARDSHGRRYLDATSASLPTVSDSSYICDHFGRGQFMALLPLLDLIQRVVAAAGWQPPPLQASIVFDDVNIRSRRYGCLNFSRLATHAVERGYHAAIAMVPLDASRPAHRAVQLFRDNPNSLSLIVHGNNHEFLELARPRTAEDRFLLVAQARQRVAAFCDSNRLPYSAIMEPPYGTVHGEFFESLDRAGYEGVLVTPRQFRESSPNSLKWRSIGLAAAEVGTGGLVVIPRITATAGWRTDATLAAFLGQPVVIAGHHYDADDQLRYIDEIANFVESLSPVTWASPSEIARTRVTAWRDRNRLWAQCYGRHVRLSIPEGVRELVIERPWLTDELAQSSACHVSVGTRQQPPSFGRVTSAIAVEPSDEVVVISPQPDGIDMAASYSRPTAPRLRMRRALAESRDRVYPHLPRALRRKSTISAT